ncbi:hypothetical protein BC937DRAFT_95403 [Endogone sp. FLAS-F59071]|nr:hypothetical protein BC937DRAFT_95403 [Endogone sp. FLAS-F59071]|eukprot:RUS20354.1 hypothetical protein BC937DRAFT_95403 [Endogone sp. FLAS-F59071]
MDEITDVIIFPGKYHLDLPSPLASTVDAAPVCIPSKVTLVLCKPLKVRSVTLRFRGTHGAYATCFDPLIAPKHDPTVTIVDIKIPLVDELTVLHRGETNLTFDLNLPADLPPSFENESGYLRYTATVKIARALAAGLRKVVKFDKVIDLRKDMRLGDGRAVDTPAEERDIFTQRRGGIIEVGVDHPSVICASQRSARLVADMMFLSGRSMPKSIVTSLEKVITVRTNIKHPNRPQRRETHHGFWERSSSSLVSDRNFWGPDTQPGNTALPLTPGQRQTAVFQICLDPTRTGHHLSSPLVEITHRFRVRVIFIHPWEEDLEFTVPVVISPIPSVSETVDLAVGSQGSESGEDDELPSYNDVLKDPVPSGNFHHQEEAEVD